MNPSHLRKIRVLNSSFNHIAAAFLIWAMCVPFAVVQAAELKIGVVNAAKVLEQAPQAEAAQQALQKEFSPRDKAIISSQKEVRKLEDKLARDGAIMSESERRKLEREIVSRKRDLKREQEEFREDLNIRRNEAFDKIRDIIRKAINDIAKSEKYDLIVGDGVIYADDRIDITDKIVGRLKQGFKQTTKQ